MHNIKLEIRRSSFWLYNYEPGNCPALERSLSVYNFLDRKYTHFGFDYDSDNKILKIPSGISIDYILNKCCQDNIIITDIVNETSNFIESRRINNIISKVKPRNKFQSEAVEFIVANNVADSHKKQRLLSLETGFGKTICTIMAVIELKIPTIITSVNLSQQWVNRILSSTDCELDKDVFFFKTRSDLEKYVNNPTPPLGSFYVIGIDALTAALRKDTEILNKFYTKAGISVQVFDEVHEHFIKIIKVLVNITVERILYLSATPSRSDKSQDSLYKKIFRDDIPTYGGNTHEVNKFNIISFRYKTKPAYGDMFRIQPRRGVNAVGYFKYMTKYAHRYFIFVNAIKYFSSKMFSIANFDKNTKILIYIQSLECITLVKNALKGFKLYNGFTPTIGDYTSNSEDKERELDCNLIFTTMSNRAGLDISGLMMIINFMPMSSDNMVKQIRGRIRNPNGWYIDATDMGFSGMVRQREKRIINHKRVSKAMSYYEMNADGDISKCEN